MTRTKPGTVDAYIARQPKDARPVLERVRDVIRRALPAAEETISYQIPAYRLHDVNVIYFAAWRRHYSIYPAGNRLTVELKRELEPYEVSKGTIKFPLDQPVPSGLIARIARALARDAAARTAAKLARRTKQA